MRARILVTALASLLTGAGCTTGAAPGLPETRAATSSSGTASTRPADQTNPAKSSQGTPSTQSVLECTAQDVQAMVRPEGDGAGEHMVTLVDFRNVSNRRCLLSGYPDRVTVHEPGHPTVTATAGSFFPVDDSMPMDPAGLTTLGVETRSTCAVRPNGGPSGLTYHEIRVTLRGDEVAVAVPGGLDVGCGVGVTRFTNWN